MNNSAPFGDRPTFNQSAQYQLPRWHIYIYVSLPSTNKSTIIRTPLTFIVYNIPFWARSMPAVSRANVSDAEERTPLPPSLTYQGRPFNVADDTSSWPFPFPGPNIMQLAHGRTSDPATSSTRRAKKAVSSHQPVLPKHY